MLPFAIASVNYPPDSEGTALPVEVTGHLCLLCVQDDQSSQCPLVVFYSGCADVKTSAPPASVIVYIKINSACAHLHLDPHIFTQLLLQPPFLLISLIPHSNRSLKRAHVKKSSTVHPTYKKLHGRVAEPSSRQPVLDAFLASD